jgi:hypothetical protein
MSEIQQWNYVPNDSDDGPWVTYADHPAAVTAALAERDILFQETLAEERVLHVAAVAAARAESLVDDTRKFSARGTQSWVTRRTPQDFAPDSHPSTYEQGQRDAFGGLSEEEYQRRIIVKNFDAGVKAARDAVVALPNRYTMEPGHMTLILAAIDGLVKP